MVNGKWTALFKHRSGTRKALDNGLSFTHSFILCTNKRVWEKFEVNVAWLFTANNNNTQYQQRHLEINKNILYHHHFSLHVCCDKWSNLMNIKCHYYPVNSLININSDSILGMWKEKSWVYPKPLMSGFSVYIPRVQQHYLIVSFACLCVAQPPSLSVFYSPLSDKHPLKTGEMDDGGPI